MSDTTSTTKRINLVEEGEVNLGNYGDKLTPYQATIFRHSWVLDRTERQKLTASYMLETTVGEFLDQLIETDKLQDKIAYGKYLYFVYYLNCQARTFYELEEEKQGTTKLLITVREWDEQQFYIMLVRLKGTFEPRGKVGTL